VGGDQAAAVHLDLAVLTDEAELDREPEETRHGKRVLLRGRPCGPGTELLEKVGEHRVRVQGNVPKDIVKNVGLGQVVELLPRADSERRGKPSLGQALKELMGRNEAADADRRPSGAR
jgi:hypothetical protein